MAMESDATIREQQKELNFGTQLSHLNKDQW